MGSIRRRPLLGCMIALSLGPAACRPQGEAPPAAEGPAAFASPPPLPEIDAAKLPVVEAQLGTPPNAAPPVNRDHPAKVVVKIEIKELVREIADGTQYTFWTFGGTVPGPMIRVRRGDVVELHLMNHPDNTMPHNIDLHAVTGPGGGATSTFTAPGHQTQFSFRALNEGVYIYHCATEQVRVLANVLGIRYRPTGTGQYSHTVRITVLDREGVVADHADGLDRPIEPIVQRVSALLAGDAAPAK